MSDSRVVEAYRDNQYHDLYQMEYRYSWRYDIWLIYCSRRPASPFRAHTPTDHIYPDGLICVAEGYEPETLDNAKAIAKVWMRGYSVYIRTGRFPNGGHQVRV